MFDASVTPYTFILQHLNFVDYVLRETHSLQVMLKKGGRYYVLKDRFFDFYMLDYFNDGIILPYDLVRSMRVLSILMQNPDLTKQYPLFTKYYGDGYYVIINRKYYGPIPVVTSSSKISMMIARRIFKNIRDI